ncbi:hypothetical protein HCN44_005667 [Aphidius gifuensis]|uniref:Mannose-6-phosphate isomerase n=1 Tax=Aphidius gifuensis TaxID=684658 RepID=A0A835CWN1_APHGI|nr:mannose-6-phosphate isomerase-like [Aphidius gifuensis]XP_044001234.1 mannose-6-phosphate isomerase-like [Aphidius gifuensis]XP_044001235.1 mannose-6-phosphate isomerase-like [Aphidius gifuensis]XP_044001236.1 mannose-6-phosphate isomerase-like [Aphidius gifuensis]KAF7996543.1 hypothetical protein HCN44_002175 [Aphidius gifuensis]KAF7997390.1 hypothetical protein HCN44_005667 [Aphidius gifuensis]
MELQCAIQNYHWGKKGLLSSVARLIKASNPNIAIDDNKPYAELWMGTHPSGPSSIRKTNESLVEFINNNNDVLGDEVKKTFGDSLPFLFKILSIATSLSIQAHPDKKRAEILNKLQPNVYKDPNHKPEIAIALTKFEALCGFRPVSEIQYFLKSVPELCMVIGDDIANEFIGSDEANCRINLRKCLEGLLTHHADSTADRLKNYLERLRQMDECSREEMNAHLFERLHADFPGDVGCFGIYFFNYVTLKPGEAIYLSPDEPHAYLSGDCVECMACSDNVVRAGLTPKLKDVPTLVEMLTYKCEPGFEKYFKSTKIDEFTEIFRPPIKDFAVAKIEILSSTTTYTLSPQNSAGILIIIEGKIQVNSNIYNEGSVLFIKSKEQLNLKILSENKRTLMFEAFANV